MPYISKGQREYWDPKLQELLDSIDDGTASGILNYLITKILIKASAKSYARYNELMGVLDCAAREFYRRKVAPYEGEKIISNGDVYEGESDEENIDFSAFPGPDSPESTA